jgi:hypothetical protein
MKKFAFGAVAVAAIASSAIASEVITSYVTAGMPGDQAFSPVGTQAANVTGNVLTRGSGLVPSAANNSISSSGWDSLDPNSDYYTFGFTVAPGYSVDLSELWLAGRSSNTGPGFLGLFYSGDNFTTNLFTLEQVGTNFNNQIIDLSDLTGLTGEVEFRVIAISPVSANGGSVAGGGTFRLSDHFANGEYSEIRFIGTVNAVPAPGALALFGVAGTAAIRRRRQA